MVQHTPRRDDEPVPWWSWFLDSSLGRGALMAAMVIVAAITIYGILTTKSHMTTVPPNPGFLR